MAFKQSPYCLKIRLNRFPNGLICRTFKEIHVGIEEISFFLLVSKELRVWKVKNGPREDTTESKRDILDRRVQHKAKSILSVGSRVKTKAIKYRSVSGYNSPDEPEQVGRERAARAEELHHYEKAIPAK